MTRGRREEPDSPTALGIRFGLPVAGLSDLSNAAQIGAGRGGFPIDHGLHVVPGQSGAEGMPSGDPGARSEDGVPPR